MDYAASMETVAPRTSPILNFVVTPDLIEKLDNFRFEYRFPARADAVRWLLEEALKQGLHPEAQKP